MYVRLHGGRIARGGYVVPCDVIKVVKEPRDGRVVKVEFLLSDDEVENEI